MNIKQYLQDIFEYHILMRTKRVRHKTVRFLILLAGFFLSLSAYAVMHEMFKQQVFNSYVMGLPINFYIVIIPLTIFGTTLAFFVFSHYAALNMKALKKAQEAAENANQSQRDFLTNISHELRTPMNGILGLTDILRQSDLNYEQRECVSAIFSSSRSLLGILNDLLDLSKIESQQFDFNVEETTVKNVLKQVKNLTLQQANEKGLTLNFEMGLDVPASLWTDKIRLTQVLTNIVNNAIKFTEEGSVTVTANIDKSSPRQQILFVIKDTGIGIPKDFQDKLFHKFSQADTSITRKNGGTGLGLTITKNLVDLMKGSISFDSSEKNGTRFYVRIPVKPPVALIPDKVNVSEYPPAEHLACQDTTPEVQATDSLSILIAEDHEINQMLIKKWLVKIGIQDITIVESGDLVLEAMEHKDFDVIFMDCQMPVMDGYQTTQIIREIEKGGHTHMNIIAMTANAMVGDKEKCLKAGMDDYLSKPLSYEKLQDTLSKITHISERTDNASCNSNDAQADTTQDIPLDLSRLKEFSDGDPEEEKLIVNLFLEKVNRSIHELRTSLDNQEPDMWSDAVHALKGASGNIGAMNMYNICLSNENEATETSKMDPSVVDLIEKELASIEKTVSTMH